MQLDLGRSGAESGGEEAKGSWEKVEPFVDMRTWIWAGSKPGSHWRFWEEYDAIWHASNRIPVATMCRVKWRPPGQGLAERTLPGRWWCLILAIMEAVSSELKMTSFCWQIKYGTWERKVDNTPSQCKNGIVLYWHKENKWGKNMKKGNRDTLVWATLGCNLGGQPHEEGTETHFSRWHY